MTGFVILVPRDEIIQLDMTVEEAVKFRVTAGMVAPDRQRPQAESPAGGSAEDPIAAMGRRPFSAKVKGGRAVEVSVSGRHMEVTDSMEKRIAEHADKLLRFDDRIQHVAVTLDREASGEKVEIIAKCHKSTLVAVAQGHDLHDTIADAFSKIEHQITRLHDRIVRGHSRQAQKASETTKRQE